MLREATTLWETLPQIPATLVAAPAPIYPGQNLARGQVKVFVEQDPIHNPRDHLEPAALQAADSHTRDVKQAREFDNNLVADLTE